MRKALVPVDGSPNSDRAVSHVVMLAEINPALEVVLLNVQPEIDDWQVRRFLKKEEVEAMEEAAAATPCSRRAPCSAPPRSILCRRC